MTQPSPALRGILSDDHWYGNGAPHWRIHAGKPNERPCQTAGQAADLGEAYIRRLQRNGHANLPVRKLIERLQACAIGTRCMSGACPVCTRALQRWFVADTAIWGRASPLAFVSIIPEYGAIELDQTEVFPWIAAVERIKRELRRSFVTTAVGGFDFSVNVPDNLKRSPFIQVHLHAALDGEGKWESGLRDAFRSSWNIPRPVIKSGKKPGAAAFAYALLNEFDRKTWFWDDRPRDDGRPPGWRTRDKPLLSHEFVTLMLLLDRIGLDARLFLMGVKRTTGDPTRLIPITARTRQSSRSRNSPK